MSKSTQVLESPSTSDTDTGPEMFHYVRKNKIAESAVMGTFVEALCGHIDWKSANGLLLFDPTDNDMLHSSQRQMEAAASFSALRCKTGAER